MSIAAADWSHATTLTATSRSAREARAFVCRHLTDHRLSHLVDPARLVVSEIATHALVHRYTPLVVTLARADQAVVVTVRGVTRSVPIGGAAQHAQASRELELLDRLGLEWGVSEDDFESVVWVVLDTRGRSAPRHRSSRRGGASREPVAEVGTGRREGTDQAEHGDPRDLAIALIKAEPADVTLEGVTRPLERTCRALAARMQLMAAFVRIAAAQAGVTGGGVPTVVVAPPGPAFALAELELTAGEGPACDANLARRPVLIGDLHGSAAAWSGFRIAALDAGVAAVFAFPLRVGAVGFGTLELFSATAGTLPRDDIALARAFAEIATETLMDGGLTLDDGGLSPSLARAFDYGAEIAQAQGMLMVDLGVSLAEVMVRLRARAFATGESLLTLARGVVDGNSISWEDG